MNIKEYFMQAENYIGKKLPESFWDILEKYKLLDCDINDLKAIFNLNKADQVFNFISNYEVNNDKIGAFVVQEQLKKEKKVVTKEMMQEVIKQIGPELESICDELGLTDQDLYNNSERAYILLKSYLTTERKSR